MTCERKELSKFIMKVLCQNATDIWTESIEGARWLFLGCFLLTISHLQRNLICPSFDGALLYVL